MLKPVHRIVQKIVHFHSAQSITDVLFFILFAAGALLEKGRFEPKDSDEYNLYQKMRELNSKTACKRDSASWCLYQEYKKVSKFVPEIKASHFPFDYKKVTEKLSKWYNVNYVLHTVHNLDDRSFFSFPPSLLPSQATCHILLLKVSEDNMHSYVIKTVDTYIR